jgi:hypothetical protein
MKIRNMISSRGNIVANQFEIEDALFENNTLKMKGTMFQSYDSNIAFKSYESGKVYLDKEYWDYSVTTGKYRNQFLGETKKETEKKIKSGEYKLVDLN